MELLLALGIGITAACGVYLLLRPRTISVVLALSLLSYATNLFLFAVGRVTVGAPPIYDPEAGATAYADPVPQAAVNKVYHPLVGKEVVRKSQLNATDCIKLLQMIIV